MRSSSSSHRSLNKMVPTLYCPPFSHAGHLAFAQFFPLFSAWNIFALPPGPFVLMGKATQTSNLWALLCGGAPHPTPSAGHHLCWERDRNMKAQCETPTAPQDDSSDPTSLPEVWLPLPMSTTASVQSHCTCSSSPGPAPTQRSILGHGQLGPAPLRSKFLIPSLATPPLCTGTLTAWSISNSDTFQPETRVQILALTLTAKRQVQVQSP